MEPKPTAPTESPTPAPASSIIDVVAPPPAEKDDGSPADPVDKLAAEDQAAQAAAKKPDKKPAQKPPKAKKSGSSVGLAITATVIIVLGLAALATYAYLQTTK